MGSAADWESVVVPALGRAPDPRIAGFAAGGKHKATAGRAAAEGANVKAVQLMLAHTSAAMTLDVYADLVADGPDEVADRLARVGRTLHHANRPSVIPGSPCRDFVGLKEYVVSPLAWLEPVGSSGLPLGAAARHGVQPHGAAALDLAGPPATAQ